MFAKKLKKLFIGRRSFPKRLLLAVLPSLALSFTLFFFGPLDLVYANREYVSYSALMILSQTAMVTGGVFAALTLLASIPGGKVHAFLVSCYTGIAIGLYVQGAFLNPNFGTLDGRTINWPSFSTAMVVNLAIWFGILLIPHLVHYFSNAFWRSSVMIISGALILMQGVSLVKDLTAQAQIDRNATGSYYLSNENMLRVGQENNIAVFLLDTVSNADLDAMLEKYPAAMDAFHDFTRYDNANSHYMFTVPSLVNLLTGQEWDCEQVPIHTYMNGAWSSGEASSFYEELAAQGYERNVYMLLPEAAKDPAVLQTAFSNLKLSNQDYAIDRQALVKLFKLSFYRYFPIAMKPFFVIYTSDISNLVTRQDAMEGEWDFVRRMNDGTLATGSSKNAFFFYYLQGTHKPYRMDERGRLIQSDLAPEFLTNYSEMEDQLCGFFSLIGEYMRQLDRLGLYDQTGIIILADHGSNADKSADHQPIYLVKMPRERHESLEISSAPITTQDSFLADIMTMTGVDGSGWGIPSTDVPDGPAERWTRAYAKDSSFPELKGSRYNVMMEYRYTGDGETLTEKYVSGDSEPIPMIDSYY